MRVDWQAEGDKGFTIYPDATYDIKIQDAERTVAGTGNPQIKWSAQIISGPFAGGKITTFTPLTEKGLWRTVQLIKAAVGITSFKKLGIMDTEDAAFTQLVNRCRGLKMRWVIVEGEYNGKKKNEVSDFLPAEDMMDEELNMSLDDIPEFLRNESSAEE